MQKDLLPESELGRELMYTIRKVLDRVGLAHMVDSSTAVVMTSYQFFFRLDSIFYSLDQEGEIGKQKILNYAGWKVVEDTLQYLSQEYRDAQSAHFQRTRGQTTLPQTPTSERCAGQALTVFPLAIGAVYVRDMVSKNLKMKVRDLSTAKK